MTKAYFLFQLTHLSAWKFRTKPSCFSLIYLMVWLPVPVFEFVYKNKLCFDIQELPYVYEINCIQYRPLFLGDCG